MQNIEKLQTLIPANVFACPKIIYLDDHPHLRLRPDYPLRDYAHDGSFGGVIYESAVDSYKQFLSLADRILLDYGRKIIDRFGDKPLEDQVFNDRTTREMLKKLFPPFKRITRQGLENDLFHDHTPSKYIAEIVLPKTKSVRQWMVDHLPEEDTTGNRFELINEVDSTRDILDLARIYAQTYTDDEYQRRVHHEALTMIGIMFPTALALLSRSEEEEEYLDYFTRVVSAHFLGQSAGRLLVLTDDDGQITKYRIDIQRDDPARFADKKIPAEFNVQHNFTLRKFSNGKTDLAIFSQRPKVLESEVCKMMRGRPLATDRLAARFVVYSDAHVNTFIDILREKLAPDWTVGVESARASQIKNPHSRLPEPKFVVRSNEYPSMPPIELQIYYLKSGLEGMGTWFYKRLVPEVNDHHYRMEQLLDLIYPFLFPLDLYGFDWSDSETRARLLRYANHQALIKPFTEFE